MRTSIEKKYAIFFSLLIATVIIACWGANSLLLGKFFVSRKISTIAKMYEQFDYTSRENGVSSDEFNELFETNAARFNCDILILDQDMNICFSNINNESEAVDRLLGYFFERIQEVDENARGVVEKNDRYTMLLSKDVGTDAGFVELFGILSTGNLIIIRSAVAGMNYNARYANVLLAYIGLIAIVISFFAVKFVSKTITRPILQIVEISDKMANLDFDTKYEGREENEIGLLGEHINRMSENLERTISELKTANTELESELSKRNELDEMRRDFLNNVSHELKTPIALIQGYAEGLEDCINDDAESRQFYLDVIIDETNKMNTLVKSLLELNELEYGKSDVSIERFNITELIKNRIQSFDVVIKQNNITVDFDDSHSFMVWSDEFKIDQVFNNYFSNAVHYAEGGDCRIRVNISENNGKARVSVFNTGNQIPEEDIDKIFDKFYKVDKARTREYGGSGIGLSIVKAAMDSLNQSFGVVNCNDGVEFWFEVDSK